MLRVYVSGHCPTCGTARERFAQLQARHPDIPAQLIDVDEPGAAVPPQVIGTPIYTWRGRVIFRGNPDERELLARVGRLDADGGAH